MNQSRWLAVALSLVAVFAVTAIPGRADDKGLFADGVTWKGKSFLPGGKSVGLVVTIAKQEHPNVLLLAKGVKILYVANANRNTVSLIDTAAV